MPAKRLHLTAVGTVRLVIAMADAARRCLTLRADTREIEQTNAISTPAIADKAKVQLWASSCCHSGGITGCRNRRAHAMSFPPHG
jgi:hypothetical protein